MNRPRRRSQSRHTLYFLLGVPAVVLLLIYAVYSQPIREPRGRRYAPDSTPHERRRRVVQTSADVVIGAGSSEQHGTDKMSVHTVPLPNQTDAPKSSQTVNSHSQDGGADGISQHGKASSPSDHVKDKPIYAYVAIITNEKYVDGAMLFVYTLRKHSLLVRDGVCETLLLIPDVISEESRHRLKAAGWDSLRGFEDLSQFAPLSHLKGTFNKLHIFGLEYKKVFFYDVDVLPVHNPDPLFSMELPPDIPIGAIGNAGDTYFKSGMMIVRPSRELFDNLTRGLRAGEWNIPSGRDGELLRRYFNGRFRPTNPVYSQYRRPWQDLVGNVVFHFRGELKPWYNPHKLPKMRPDSIDLASPAYRLWWEEYHAMHYDLYVDTARGYFKGESGKWGGADGVTAKTHLWLLKHTPDGYVMPLWGPSSSSEPVLGARSVVLHGHNYTCDSFCRDAHKACVKGAKSDKDCASVCNKWQCNTYCSPPATADPAAAAEGSATVSLGGRICQSVCGVGTKASSSVFEKRVHCADRSPLPPPKPKDEKKKL